MRKIKRFYEGIKHVTFAYAEDSLAATLLVKVQTPGGMQSLALDCSQTKELIKWLEAQLEEKQAREAKERRSQGALSGWEIRRAKQKEALPRFEINPDLSKRLEEASREISKYDLSNQPIELHAVMLCPECKAEMSIHWEGDGPHSDTCPECGVSFTLQYREGNVR